MDANDRFIDIRNALKQRPNSRRHFARRRIADRIGNINRRSARCNRRFDYLAEEIDFSSARVFRREFNVRAISLRAFDAGDGARNDLLLGHAQLKLAVNRARRQEDVNTRFLRFFQRFPRAIDIVIDAPRQTANNRALNDAGDFANRLKIAFGRDGKTRFDHVDAEIDQRLRDFQFLLHVHTCARRLFAVAQGGVKNDNLTARIPVLIIDSHRNIFLFSKTVFLF